MSINSWKKEFYPKNASKRMTKKEAIEHSLLKWTGLVLKNLKKHDLLVDLGGNLADNEGKDFEIYAGTCALCVKYYKDTDSYFSDESTCGTCPLFQSLGHPCDQFDEGESPYHSWIRRADPKPMIKALKRTLKENS